MKIAQLIKLLATKEQQAEVEFIVATPEGNLVCMEIERTAQDIASVLKAFGPRK